MTKWAIGAVFAAILAFLAFFAWRQASGLSHGQIYAAVRDGTDAVLGRIDARGDRLEGRLGQVSAQLDRVEAKLDRILELAARPLPDGLEPAR